MGVESIIIIPAGSGQFLHTTGLSLVLLHLLSSFFSCLFMHVFCSSTNRQIYVNSKDGAGLSGRSQALGAVLSLLLVVLTICLFILLLHKRERR